MTKNQIRPTRSVYEFGMQHADDPGVVIVLYHHLERGKVKLINPRSLHSRPCFEEYFIGGEIVLKSDAEIEELGAHVLKLAREAVKVYIVGNKLYYDINRVVKDKANKVDS